MMDKGTCGQQFSKPLISENLVVYGSMISDILLGRTGSDKSSYFSFTISNNLLFLIIILISHLLFLIIYYFSLLFLFLIYYFSSFTISHYSAAGSSTLDQILSVLLQTNVFVGGLAGFALDNTIPRNNIVGVIITIKIFFHSNIINIVTIIFI